MNPPPCPNCARPATRVALETDGSTVAICDGCPTTWWLRPVTTLPKKVTP